MPIIETLTTLVTADVNPLRDEFSAALAEADTFSTSMGKVDVAPNLGGGGIADGIGDQIRAAIMTGMAPLGGFAARFEKSFDKVGGTVVTLARRLDSAMKFPAFDAFLGKVQERMPGAFAKGSIGAIRGLAKVKGFLDHLGDVAGKGLGKMGMAPVPGGVITSYARTATTITGIGPASRVATRGVKSLGQQLALSLGLFGSAAVVVQFFTKGVKGAANLNESLDMTRSVFGEASSTIVSESDRMAAAFGVPKREFIDGAAALGTMGKAAGMSEGKAAEFGTTLAKLALDVGSLKNLSMEETLQKLQSGLSGESEPLRRIGVFMTDASIKAEAMRMGLVAVDGELTEGQKIQARAAFITRSLSDAQGNLADTLGSTKNQSRQMVGNIGNLATTIGTMLEPATNAALGGLNAFTTGAVAWVEKNRMSFEAAASYVGKVFADIGGAVTEGVAFLGDFAARAAEKLGITEATVGSFGEIASNVFITLGEGLSSVGGFLGGLATEAATALGDLGSWFGVTGEAAGGLGEVVADVFGGIGFAVRNLGEFMSLGLTMLKEGIANTIEWITVIPENLLNLATWFGDNWTTLISDALGNMYTFVTNLAGQIPQLIGTAFLGAAYLGWKAIEWLGGRIINNFVDVVVGAGKLVVGVFTGIGNVLYSLGKAIIDFVLHPTRGFQFNFSGLLDGMKNTAEKLPEVVRPALTDLQKSIDKTWKKIDDKEAARANRPALDLIPKMKPVMTARPALPAIAPAPGDLGKVTRKDKARDRKEAGPMFAGALQLGSKEAFSAIAKATSGRGGDGISKVEKATLDGNKDRREHTAILRSIDRKLGGTQAPIEVGIN